MADQRTVAQFLKAPTKGYEDAIVVPAITADNFELKHGAAQIWLEKEPPRSILTWDDLVSKFINKFFPPSKTTSLRNEITNFQQRFDETFREAWDRFKDLLRACPRYGFSELHQLDMFYNALNSKDQDSLNSAAGGNFLDKMPRDCLSIIESKSKVRYSRDKAVVSKVSKNASTSGVSPDVAELKDMVRALLLDKKGQNQSPAPVKAVEKSCVTCGGAHSYRICPATDGNIYRNNIQEYVSQASAVNYNQGNTAYVKANDAVMKNMQTQGQNMQNQLTNLTDLITKFGNSNTASTLSSGTLPSNTIANPKSDLKAIATRSVLQSLNQKASIPYPSRSNDERNREKANNQIEKLYQIFKDMSFEISFVDALILMPKFASTLKALIGNKEKFSEMARTSLNEHCSAVLLKKLPKKLGDPGKFLIPCDFPGMAECLALADLGASINLMPLSVWKKLYLPDLTPTYMTLELADRSISSPVGVAEDVYVKVGSFHFPADFVVVDFDDDPRVPLILERSFLKTERALIDVFEGELTLRVGKEAITFNLDQTSRKFWVLIDTISSGNPTPSYDPIVSATSSTLTPFGNSDFLLEEVDAFLAVEDEPTSSNFLQPYLDPDGNYLPEVRKELKICEAKINKSSVDEPSVVELKALPPHLEYAFLEDDDKLPVITAKDLSVEEKTVLITVLKSHKRAIAWKLSDIKGINPEFYTHKILMEENFTPAVQHQRRVNPKIHDVIKQEVIKLLDAGLIYPISNSPWNSFQSCLSHLEKMLKRCEDTNLYLNWEKSHFMVKEGIVLGHKISKQGIEVDKAKVDVISKLPHPTTVKGIRSFLGHAGFYRRFIKDFPKIARPMTRLLEKDTPFIFSQECVDAFQTLKRKLTEAPILIAPDWDMPFELMCDASDFAIGAVLGQRQDKHFRPIHYASKTMIEAESKYTTTEKEMLAVVYAIEKFRSYLILNKSIVYTDHSALKYLFAKKDSKAKLLRWVLLLQEFTFKVVDTKGAKNMAANHFS
nr:hypothetical protein [Tanacetum cinerariifolium]